MKTLTHVAIGRAHQKAVTPKLCCILPVLGLFAWSALAQSSAPPQIPAAAAQPAPAEFAQAPVAAPPAQVPANAAQEPEAPQTLHLLIGHSLLITSPTRIKRISLADPNIADATVVSPFQVLLNGKAAGGVSLIIWDESDQSQTFEVSVDIDILGLTQTIHEAFAGEPVEIETSGNVVMLTGRVSSAEVAQKIEDIVKNVAPKVTNLMQIPPPPASVEISLQVRFAEVNHVAIEQLGANFIRNFGSNMPLSITTGQFSPPSLGQTQSVTSNGQTSTTTTSGNQFAITNLLNLAIFRPDINLDTFIQALQEHNLLEILAEPNLLTESGKDASFLAGGQFPYPVPQSAGGAGGFTTITIQFKEFGVRLNFTPTALADGTIHLKVAPEVSSLDFTNALQLNGFLIPALSVNNLVSEVDLKDGQSFAIAGLLDNRVTDQLEKIPGIGDIPILGKLFQSRALNKSNNELLIVATPHIVHPIEADEPVPALTFPSSFLPVTSGSAAQFAPANQNSQAK